MQDDKLGLLLAEAAANPPQPSAALMDRVLADALALQPAPRLVPRAPAPQPGPFARLAALFGGAPGLAAVSAAAVLGFAVGYLDPTTLDTIGQGLAGGTEEMFPTVDFLTDEG